MATENKPRRYKWTLEIEVDESWVADGFDFNENRVQDLTESLIGYAKPGEVSIRVIEAPTANRIREAQGFQAYSPDST